MNDRPISPSTWIDDDIVAAIEDLFPRPESAYMAAGAPGYGFPDAWREPVADKTRPILDRLRELDQLFRAHLRLMADQVPEFSDQEDLARLRGEGMSILISMRELHNFVPELDE